MKQIRIFSSVLAVTAIVAVANACPFCLAPMQTWAEIVRDAEVVCLVRLVSVDEGSESRQPHSVVEVVSLHKGQSRLPNRRFRVERRIYGRKGETFLLTATLHTNNQAQLVETFATDSDGEELTSPIRKVSATDSELTPSVLAWDFVEKVTPEVYAYVTESPRPSEEDRLRYFLPFLEHPHPLVAADAWGEFANSNYEQIKLIRSELPRDRLRTWISQVDTAPNRLGLYGMLLGLCGDESDAAFLRQQILLSAEGEERFGIEGLMGGLMLIMPESGLDFIQHDYMVKIGQTGTKGMPVITALGFVWTYEPELLSKDRLRAVLRQFLENEQFREIIVTHLARWNDWSLIPRLDELYEQVKVEDPRTAKAIERFAATCIKSEAADSDQKLAAITLLNKIEKEQLRVDR